jgi:hypothetical protein
MIVAESARRWAVCGTAALVFAGLAARAAAGPPFITDDPEPVPLHDYEFYIGSSYFHTKGGTVGDVPHFEFNYGAEPDLQLHIIAPVAFEQAAGSRMQCGYGDTELGAKYRFVQEGKSTPMVGVFPLVEVPTGDANSGLGNGKAQIFLPVWLQKSSGAWMSYGGGGFWHNPGTGNKDYWFFGLEVQNQVTKQLALGVELFHSTATPTVDGSAQTGFNVGAMYDFDDGHHLLFSVGRGFESDNVLTAYLAYQWTFGPKSKE